MVRSYAVAASLVLMPATSLAQSSIPDGITPLSPQTVEAAPQRVVENTPVWTITEGAGGTAGGVENFKSADGRFSAGSHKFAKMTLQLKNYPHDEFIHIVSGRVTIIDPKGVGRTYGPGDSFVMKKGFTGTWKQLEPIVKIAVSYTSQ